MGTPLIDIPTGWDPQAKQQQRVALADFSAAPWQGFEKSECCSGNSSLFLPQAVVVVVALGCWLRLVAAALFESLILHAQTYEREYNKKEPPTKVGDSRLVKRHSGKHCVPGRHSYWSRTRGLSNSDGLRLLIFPQPLGEALKNQNAAPTAPPCFSHWLRSSPLHWAVACPACGRAVLFESLQVPKPAFDLCAHKRKAAALKLHCC